MTAYYPSQASYGHHAQPAVVYPSSAGYGQSYGGGYGQSAGGVMYVPSYGSSRRRPRHHNNYYSVPQVMPSMAAPMVMAPSHGHGHPHYSFGSRMRRFFGLAPRNGVRYKSDRGTWGFMGYSRRQRYVDARTGGEVDRQGRPVYRV